MQTSLKETDESIHQLRESIEDLRVQMADHKRMIEDQMTETLNIKQQLVDQNLHAIDTSKEIEEVYDCLDLLDDRLLEFGRMHKTKKQLRREKKEIEMLDQKNPAEECFDEFIADCLVYDPEEKIDKNELKTLFREWCDKTHQKIRTTEVELEGYMLRNFGPPTEPDNGSHGVEGNNTTKNSTKVRRKENSSSVWMGLKPKSTLRSK